MRKGILIGLVSLLSSFGSMGQLNMTELGNLDFQSLHNVVLNDIWGWVDGQGNEYAIVGTTDGVSIVDISDPTNPTEVFWQPGMNSVWRDIKTWNDHAYITTEAEEGLLIIDMSTLPGNTNLDTTVYKGPPGMQWASAHNLFIDENGHAYIFGSNRGAGGAIILDLTIDPMAPVEIGTFDNWYIHDGMARGDTLYSSHISDGFFSIVDVSNPSSPVLLGTAGTPSTFTHNCWVSDDGDHLYTTDEVTNGFVGAYDIIDPTDIKETDRIQSSPGDNTIPHNTHFLDDYIITSWYRDGVVIHDVAKPHNMVEVGNFDTSPSLEGPGFEGCWGVYPYLPSGNIIASDRQNGLYVLGVNYQRAAYLEGNVTDAQTNMPLNQVEVTIEPDSIVEMTDLSGNYFTGIGQSGTYDVIFSKPTYFPDTIQNISLSSGVTVVLDHQLEPMPPFTLTINVVEAGTNNPIENAQVLIENEDLSYSQLSDVNGEVTIFPFYEYDYNVIAGKWGWVNDCYDDFHFDASTNTLTLELKQGFYDDFALDFGWTESGNAVSGKWTREVPSGTGSAPMFSNPNVDAMYDCFETAFVTGNVGVHPDTDDIDEGFTVLTSPTFDISGMADPHINYQRWFFNRYGPYPTDDSMIVYLDNGTTRVGVDTITHLDSSEMSQWVPVSVRVLDHITTADPLQLEVYIADLDTFINITEGGFDYFYISEGDVSSVDEDDRKEGLAVYPNPFNEGLTIDTPSSGVLELRDMSGRVVARERKSEGVHQWQLNVPRGIYILTLITEEGQVSAKVMK